MSDVRAKAIEEANAIIESHDQLEKIAITTFSKLGPLGHIHIRNTLLDITMSNGIAVHSENGMLADVTQFMVTKARWE